MGSQSVTDFSAARKKRIQTGILRFDPDARQAPSQARQAGLAAMGSLAPTSSFVQALTSVSVDVAAKTLAGFVTGLKESSRSERRTEEVLSEYGVRRTDQKPYAALVAGLRRKLGEDLNASSKKSEAMPAAEDAIGRTILDVIARRLPEKSEPSDVGRKELVYAIRRTPTTQFSGAFLENVITSLLRQAFDAAREEIPRARIEALVKEVESALAKKLATRLTHFPKS